MRDPWRHLDVVPSAYPAAAHSRETAAEREGRLHDQLLAVIGVVICGFIVAIAALAISVQARGHLVPAVRVQVSRDDHALKCNITGTGPSRVVLSCVPQQVKR